MFTYIFKRYERVSNQFSSVQLLSCVQLFATPWTAAHQASLSLTSSRSLLKLMSIESVMPSNHLILCRPLLLPPSIFPSIRVFSSKSILLIKWTNYWSFRFPMNIQHSAVYPKGTYQYPATHIHPIFQKLKCSSDFLFQIWHSKLRLQ